MDAFDEFMEHGQEWIQEEIERARERNLPWTPWREMYTGENLGAMRCCTRPKPRHCTKTAVYVSYATGVNGGFAHGRIVRCEGCFARHAKRGKK